MQSKERRDFLRMTTMGLSNAAMVGLLPSSIRKAMAIPAHRKTGTIKDVEHIVIHMQENRSFDHYFGVLNGVRGFGDPRAVRLPDNRPVWQQTSDEHVDGYVMPFHGDSVTTTAYTVDGSGQSHQDNLTILNGGRYDAWGASKELHKRMVYYDAHDLPFYHALASAFTICDHYHCSTLTQTYPNRHHLFTGCNGGGTVGGDPVMSNAGEDETPSACMDEDKKFAAYTWTTYAERLQAAGVTWKVYQEYDNFGDNLLSVYKNFRPADKTSELYRRGRSWVSEHDPDPSNRKRSDGTQLVEAFRRDLKAGTLPQVSWIVTAADLSEHPDHVPANGENVTARLVEALTDFPDMFAKTVFILNYDETGGMFDHMPPPRPPASEAEGISTVSTDGEFKHYADDGKNANLGKHPIGLGMRVPAIIVSPWTRGGWVCSEVFDHTSVLRFVEERFGVREENISNWRRSVCGNLLSAFDFTDPENDCRSLALADTADYLARVARSKNGAQLHIPAAQAATRQGAGQRRARALPYILSADALRSKDGRFSLKLANRGKSGVVFHVYDYGKHQGRWVYTIEAGKELMVSPWNAQSEGDYDLAVHGPNGFYRRFKGNSEEKESLEVITTYEPERLAIMIEIHNQSPQSKKVTITHDEAYRLSSGQLQVQTISLRPGTKAQHRISVAGSDRWYGLTLRSQGDGETVWQYAGHLENGRASKTDPAIGAMRLGSS
ncbi:MAG: phospholipase C, phosphocholine-specific [Edaphobacter sp.]|uniref:phosphocholine-specific phospholipase C n=1 Tax=Edaphobacter sp. TaxID=1934404 RepID=UPI00239A6992|nr:phospholipase C, phosphocholine-specific [Edaphobacter sp.]MDE1177454.1 phospholipase C, phosphocholine-specific [Edaphobacter sp.]